MRNLLSSKYAGIGVFVSSMIVPGSGLVLLGKPARGLMYVVWMLFFGFLTYKATSPDISAIGRFSGGIAVWALSLVEVYRLVRVRNRKQ